MKRYEMIQALAKSVHIEGRENIDSNHSYAIAESLLSKAEELGMLPPTVMLSSTGDFMPTKELLDEANIDYEPLWEI
jgi:hypothetical protein